MSGTAAEVLATTLLLSQSVSQYSTNETNTRTKNRARGGLVVVDELNVLIDYVRSIYIRIISLKYLADSSGK